MKMILAPVDFSPVSQTVVETAAVLAKSVDAYVVLVHVVSLPLEADNYQLAVAGYTAAALRTEREADKQLAALRRQVDDGGVPCQVIRLSGYPRTLIPELARKYGADYIVIGSHPHSSLYQFVAGSTVDSLIKEANCPVIVVPKPAARPVPAAAGPGH
jgi:nucleotide-binding universal stress UspA family protein